MAPPLLPGLLVLHATTVKVHKQKTPGKENAAAIPPGKGSAAAMQPKAKAPVAVVSWTGRSRVVEDKEVSWQGMKPW
jgi:hypothetical protein